MAVAAPPRAPRRTARRESLASWRWGDRIAYMSDTIAMLKAGLSGGSAGSGGASAAWVASQNQATSDLYASGAGDVREYRELVAPAAVAALSAQELTPLSPLALDLPSLDISTIGAPPQMTCRRLLQGNRGLTREGQPVTPPCPLGTPSAALTTRPKP